jgi:hypothetical protein
MREWSEFYCKLARGLEGMTAREITMATAERQAELRDGAMANRAIFRKLAWLASRTAQERYMIHSTKDAYLLREELLMDAMGVVEAVQQNRIGLPKLSESQRVAILRDLKPLSRPSSLQTTIRRSDNSVRESLTSAHAARTSPRRPQCAGLF